MIKYKLICKDCNNIFDSWFSSSKEYEKLKKKKYLNCHICNSQKIEKTLMAPNVLNSSDIKSKDIIGYGASTKGNIVLNHCNLNRNKLNLDGSEIFSSIQDSADVE